MFRVTPAVVVILTALLSPALAPAQVNPSIRQVELAPFSGQMAVNPDGGAIAVLTGDDAAPVQPAGQYRNTLATADSVTLYPDVSAKASAVRPITRRVGSGAASVAFKRLGNKAAFVVLCQGDRSLHLLDAANLQPLAKPISLKSTDRPFGLAVASGAEAPYAFYISGFNHNARAHRVNLQIAVDEGRIVTDDEVGEISVSADGSILYGRKPGTSPSGIRAWRLLPPPEAEAQANLPENARGIPTATLTNEHSDSRTYFPDPFNQSCAFGNNLYTADLSRTLATLPNPPALFLPDRPVFFATAGDQVTAHSSNTFKTLGTVTLPAPEPANDRIGVRRPGQPAPRRAHRNDQPGPTFLFADVKNGNLLLSRDFNVWVIPLKSFSVPDEPLLFADVQGQTSAHPGKPATLKLLPRDPRAKVELKSGPEGMRLQGDQLAWTPGATSIGTVKATLRVYAPGVERDQEIEFTVRRQAVDLPFVADDFRLARDGKVAVVLSRGQDPNRGFDPNAQGPGSTQLALIDMATLAVTARRTLPLHVTAFDIDSKFVYVALRDSDAFYVLGRKDLSDHKRVFTPGRIQHLVPVADSYVFTASADRGQTARFRLPDFAAVEDAAAAPGRRLNPFASSQTASIPLCVGQEYYFNGALYDRAFAKVKFLHLPFNFPTLQSRGQANAHAHLLAGQQFDRQGRPIPPLARWGAVLQHNTVRRGGQSIGNLAGLDHVILDDAPAVASLQRPEPDRSGGNPRANMRLRFEIVLRDLLTATGGQTLVLTDEPVSREVFYRLQQSSHDNRSSRLASAPGVLAALVRDRLYVLPTSSLPVQSFATPLHFDLQQETLILDPSKATTLTTKASGGKQPIEFAPSAEFPGINIDRRTGKVTLDSAPLHAKAAELVFSTFQSGYSNQRDPATGQPLSPDQAVAAFARDLSQRFEPLVGRPANGIPVFLPIPLTARDAEQQSATYDAGVFVEVPLSTLTQRLAQAQEQQKQLQEQQRAAIGAQAQGYANRPADPREVAALKQKIAELEQRNQQLEAQVQLLKEMVQGRPNPRSAVGSTDDRR